MSDIMYVKFRNDMLCADYSECHSAVSKSKEKGKHTMNKAKTAQRICIITALVVLDSSIITACDRQGTIAYFNHIEATESDTQTVTEVPEEDPAEDAEPAEETNKADTTSQASKTEGTNQTDAAQKSNETKETDKTESNVEIGKNSEYKGKEVSLIMVGDILLHTPVAESGVQKDGSYNFDAIFSNVKDDIEAADLALVNEEVIIGGEELGVSGYPSFNAPYELGDALVDAGFDVVLHATNHTLDQGKKGVKNCLSFWKNEYPKIAVLGINESQDAQDNQIYVYEQDGIRIAILNYTYGTNGIALPADMPYAVNLLEEEKVTADLAKAKELADFVVVCPHWGTEYQLIPDAMQEYWTKLFLENGVDLVIGTHPHVIEPVEWIDREDSTGERDGMLVYYSLGNFVNWTASSGEGIADRMVGGMAQVTIGMDGKGNAFIVDYGIEPLVCHVSEGTNGVTVYRLSDYTDALAAKNAIVQQDGAFSKEYCEELCGEVWGELD